MWTPLISNNTNRIKDKIDQIAKEVENSVIDVNEFGLLSGASGKALFLAYYGQYANDEKYIEKANTILFDILTKINKNQNFNPLFSNGIAGLLWVIHHLAENNFIEVDFNQMFAETNEYLSEQLIKMYDITSEYDFFHGCIGIANYLLKDRKYKDTHDTFIEKLKGRGIFDKNTDTIKWISVIKNANNEREQVINLGLSHGISSIIAYLNKYVFLYGKTNELSILLAQSVNFIKSNEQDLSTYRSFFPNWISDDINTKNSGLRWCYGDLGIAYTLHKSSFILNDPRLRAYSEQVLLKAANEKIL
jgi:lantibiotic modifying enzyme